MYGFVKLMTNYDIWKFCQRNLSFAVSLLHAEKQRESPAKLRCQIKDKAQLIW